MEANLKVAGRYIRAQGRPIGRLEAGDEVGFQDEVILLEIGVQDIGKFNTLSYCVNCHYYKPGNVSKEEASSLPLYTIYTFPHNPSSSSFCQKKKADCRIFISFTLLPTPL